MMAEINGSLQADLIIFRRNRKIFLQVIIVRMLIIVIIVIIGLQHLKLYYQLEAYI